ncbi:sigma-70 family RNA polymerase sigma factor [Pseudoflavitalea sp. G-6-1-2]|uniref:RNA polymerase sigma factor n=1 Tax=Pseudoflavitalea sp. G-6-1-2 TaxID=2728841 RepID=UPI00146B2509|nr:sigma-70 family RNA polymerase sigma factor [Pseudoflavitalea sp. G-6-1-2]NML22427.1 sigma-70 family RNA polymerase sigma factor [Pseudoflavitalea sp. G-6-1-2]
MMTTIPQYKTAPLHLFHYQFTSIVHNWTTHLQYTSWQITRNKQVAEDIVQEAFLALWQQRAKIIPENPVGWLIKVVTNLSVRYIRDRNIQVRIHKTLSNHNNTHCTHVEEHLIGKEKHMLLKQIFNQLPSQQKTVLLLSKEKGLNRAEIAAFLQLSPNTVKVHLNRAVQFMKENLTCICIILLLFICNNIFFKKSNTKDELMELFNKRYQSSIITQVANNSIKL